MHKTLTTIVFRWIAPLLVLTAGIWFVYAMGTRQKPGRKKAPPRKSVPVEIVHAQPHNGPVDIVVNGVAVPWREVRLSAQVGGEVIYKAASLSPGRVVTKNEVLVRIDPQDYQLEVNRLKQELAKADLDLSNLKVRTENTERLLTLNQRMVSLRQKDVDRISRLQSVSASSLSEADAVEMALLTANEQQTTHENQLREFTGQMQSLNMSRDLVALQLQKAELDLARTEVRAPFDGVVIDTNVEQNAMLSAGSPIASLEDTSEVEVRSNLRADDLDFILQHHVESVSVNKPRSDRLYELPDVPVTVEYHVGEHTHRWDGVLSRRDGIGLDEKTRTLPVRICVKNPSSRGGSSLADPQPVALVRGMFVKVRLHCQSDVPLLSLPEAVLRPGKSVWLMKDEKLHIEPVSIVRIEDGTAILKAQATQFSGNDYVISSPVPNARNGLAVSMPAARGQKAKNSKNANGASRTGSGGGRPPQARKGGAS